MLRDHALRIWHAAVEAARPRDVVRAALSASPLAQELATARRLLVVGAGKAGVAMSQGVEDALGADLLQRTVGLVNVPELAEPAPLRQIELHGARPVGSNQPTEQGVAGAERILELFASAGPDDVGLCLLSGGGSALLPAPAEGVTLDDKQRVTKLLHACGATINEMNAVRKHLSRIKGGRLAQAFRGRRLFSLVVSDVIGDPLDVIASGPTAPDPSTFPDALGVLVKYQLLERVPRGVVDYLERGIRGELAETLKTCPPNVQHLVLANNALSLRQAERTAAGLGYRVLNLGSFIEGETQAVAVALAGVARSILHGEGPLEPPACLLSGGETTVTLSAEHGKGGRNQEFVLAAGLHLLATEPARPWLVLSGGTDGEDGPTDAAGACCDAQTFQRAKDINAADFLRRHDAYPFFDATGDLLRTGLTQTNVMDVRVILVGTP